MWPIQKIYVGVAFVAFYVYGVACNRDAIKRKELIESRFLPVDGKLINTTYQYNLSPAYHAKDNFTGSNVVLKILYRSEENNNQYYRFFDLNAMTDSDVERYGISRVYHFKSTFDLNRRSKYAYIGYLYVLTPFECDLWYRRFVLNTTFQTIDCLILLRDFVRQSKYMHSRGVLQNRLNPTAIALTKSRSFLYDFRFSTRMIEARRSGDVVYGSRRFHQQNNSNEKFLRLPIDDWESFLYVMADIARVQLDFLSEEKHRKRNAESKWEEFGRQKANTTETIHRITEDIKCGILKEVMLRFATEIFENDGSLPKYNDFEDLIMEKINLEKPQQDRLAVFSWLKGKEREEAMKDLEAKGREPFHAQIIADPKEHFHPEDYYPPNYYYFDDLKKQRVKQEVAEAEKKGVKRDSKKEVKN